MHQPLTKENKRNTQGAPTFFSSEACRAVLLGPTAAVFTTGADHSGRPASAAGDQRRHRSSLEGVTPEVLPPRPLLLSFYCVLSGKVSVVIAALRLEGVVADRQGRTFTLGLDSKGANPSTCPCSGAAPERGAGKVTQTVWGPELHLLPMSDEHIKSHGT